MKFQNLVDTHLHSTGSDGKFSPEEVAKSAIKQKLKFICFADHYPPPPKFRDWGQKRHSKKYIEEVKRLKQKIGKIEVALGAEFDWLKDYKEYTEERVKNKDYDYILGSIHFISDKTGEYYPLNYTEKIWNEAAEKLGGVKELIKEFYKQSRSMIKSRWFDCIAHLDVIKTFNCNSHLFSEDESWYKKEVVKTLDDISKAKMCMEINTSGWRYPVNEQFPSRWIIKKAKKRNIPITIGSDGHEEAGQNIQKAFEVAKQLRYKSICIFKNRKKFEVELK